MGRIEEIKNEVGQCRKLIEEQLHWIESSEWTRREYELLVELIFEKTGILLSLSTIRRIWNDDFKNIPHKSTLDALAVFAGFSSWQNFIESNPQARKQKDPPPQRHLKPLFFGGIIAIVIIAVIGIILQFNGQKKDVEIVGELSFTYFQKSDTGVPGIVVFDYNVENILADSFFIVESTHNYEKKNLKLKKGQLTSAYYRPGNYEAFLVANDSVIKKLNIEILSNGWVGMVNYHKSADEVPFYFYTSDIIDNGILSVSRDLLLKNNIRIEDDLFVTLSKTFDSGTLIHNNFIFKTRVRSDSVEINSSSPTIYIGLLFEKDFCYVPLVQNGGQGRLQLKYGKTILTSNDSDLSGLGCNIFEWQEVEIRSVGDSIIVVVDGQEVLGLRNNVDMGYLKGFSFNFEGIGSVDFVSVLTLEGENVYSDSF